MAEVLLKGSGRLLLVVLVLRPSQMSVSGLLAALSKLQLLLWSRRGAGAGVQLALEVWEKSRGCAVC